MKELYIVLIRAHTGIGSAARCLTGYPYTHIAVSLDRSLTDFLSFSRRYHSFPFDAGFMHEYRDFYAFGSHRDVGVKVFRLPVSDARYAKITAFLHRCAQDKSLRFNLFSMATMPLLGGFRIAKAENCMSFTAQIIRMSGCVHMDKSYWRYSIHDMDRLLADYYYFEGLLERRSSAQYESYMQPFCIIKYLRDAAELTGTLMRRMLTHRAV